MIFKIECVIPHADEKFGHTEFDNHHIRIKAHGLAVEAQCHFIHKVGGGALLRSNDPVDLETLENGFVEFVDRTCIDMLHSEFFQDGHGADACAEVLADGNYHKIDVFKWQHFK